MIICPNCNYQNPEGASQCEACYTPLPSLTTCPNCGAQVQADASFCGQCGHNLANQPAASTPPPPLPAEDPAAVEPPASPINTAPIEADPLVPPDPLAVAPPPPIPPDPIPDNIPTAVNVENVPVTTQPQADLGAAPQTQLQSFSARLLHVQTDTLLELPVGISRLNIGKPNDRVPPDIDVSGFPESDIVSRVHGAILIEGDVHYIEDVGSSNGTYINNLPLAVGNRHRLRPGDRIALGKGDKVSFIFQLV
ncbi:FHA domain-containing protein [Leptothoe kymatousa]|uniref:FHA domain-containing protein n=1 Tax=Leptothoe kymatousa TAU-MAC 1615 TaxID=2364775 RepID=A0ABS5XZW1_9CYAN|nr:FHA domain-containing protein [Leptothoe kymatousa]MBT9311120.1 FHA domain-containing protein [Leptothoe kymatousa TAU-MAC 1615]